MLGNSTQKTEASNEVFDHAHCLHKLPNNCVLLVEFEGGVYRVVNSESNLGSPKQIHLIIPRHCEGTIDDLQGNKLTYSCDLLPVITAGINLNKIPKTTPPKLQQTIYEALLAIGPRLAETCNKTGGVTENFTVIYNEISYNATIRLEPIQRQLTVSA